MKFTITQMNRTVELDDVLATEYEKYDDILEYPFVIALCIKYGDIPKNDEISDEELSSLCNDVLLEEMKCLSLLPKALEVMNLHRDELSKASQDGSFFSYELNDRG